MTDQRYVVEYGAENDGPRRLDFADLDTAEAFAANVYNGRVIDTASGAEADDSADEPENTPPPPIPALPLLGG